MLGIIGRARSGGSSNRRKMHGKRESGECVIDRRGESGDVSSDGSSESRICERGRVSSDGSSDRRQGDRRQGSSDWSRDRRHVSRHVRSDESRESVLRVTKQTSTD